MLGLRIGGSYLVFASVRSTQSCKTNHAERLMYFLLFNYFDYLLKSLGFMGNITGYFGSFLFKFSFGNIQGLFEYAALLVLIAMWFWFRFITNRNIELLE